MTSKISGTDPSAAAIYEVTDGTATITLNRPEVLNAVNADLSTAVGENLERAARDDGVRSVVLTGSGRAFCAGADLKELALRRPIYAYGHAEWGFAGVVRHWIDKPLIAAVNGVAVGGGTEIALACDLVIAAESATFGLPEVKRGLLAAAGGVVRLQRQLPLKRALALALTGDEVAASSVERWGLINEVVPDGEVLTAALTLAARIGENAPLSITHTKQMVYRTLSGASDWNTDWAFEDPWKVNETAARTVLTSRDALEGSRAFAEKRQPIWERR